MLSADQIITSLEQGSGVQLSEEDRHLLQQYHNGRALKQLVFMPGWKVLLDAFEQHKQDATDELLKINPGDKESVTAAHAVAYAVHQTLDNLRREVENAIQLSEEVPEILRQNLTI